MICQRCGIEYPVYIAKKRQERDIDDTTCSDCYILDAPLVAEYKGCRPWHGEVDDDFRPMKNGKLWKPGVRKCGHADCVKAAHIEGMEELAEKLVESVKRIKKVEAPKPRTKKVKWTKVKPAPRVRPKKVDWELDALDLELLLPGATALDLENERYSKTQPLIK